MISQANGTGLVGYNVQVAVDTRHHLVVPREVTSIGGGRTQLSPMAKAAREVAAWRDLAIQLIKKRFDRAVAEGELATGTDTEALARFYAAVIQGMSAQACDGDCSETLRRLADIALSAWPGRQLDPQLT